MVFKPAELVPGCAWELVDILHRAGVPEGVLNLVMGSGREIGATLTGSHEVNGVSFTGSVATGERILNDAQTHRARVQLEMGGKNPLVVLDDADLEVAIDVAMQGAFGSTGQRCTASSRLVVQAGIHDRFVEQLTKRMQGWVVVTPAKLARTWARLSTRHNFNRMSATCRSRVTRRGQSREVSVSRATNPGYFQSRRSLLRPTTR